MVSHKQGLIALFAATIIISVNGLGSKAIPLDALTITFVRCAIAFGTLSLVLGAQKGTALFRLKNARSYWQVILLGILLAVHWTSFFHAMQISTVAVGILAHYSYPVITVIAEPLLTKKIPKLQDICAGIAVLIGVAIMVPTWDLKNDAFWGVMFGLVSACAWAARNILQRRWLSSESGQSIMTYQLLVITLLLIWMCDFKALAITQTNSWLMLALLGIVGTALGHTLIAIALRVISAKSVSLISCLQPPQAILLSWLLIAEIPNSRTIIGGSIILSVALYEATKLKATPT